MSTLLVGALVVSLSACATSHVAGTARDTDLELLRLGVDALTTPRQSAGAIQHPHQARSEDELMAVALDLDDLSWLAEADKARTRAFVHSAVEAIRVSRVPACAWWQVACKREARTRLKDSPLQGGGRGGGAAGVAP